MQRDLLAMIKIIRGTLSKEVMTDTKLGVEAEIALKGKSEDSAYTFSDPKYWDEYYMKNNDTEIYEWYVNGLHLKFRLFDLTMDAEQTIGFTVGKNETTTLMDVIERDHGNVVNA